MNHGSIPDRLAISACGIPTSSARLTWNTRSADGWRSPARSDAASS
jgi:hypothetical protein